MTILKDKLDELRLQQAADWLQRLREGAPEAHPEFIGWISESPANLRAFLTIDALSGACRAVLKTEQTSDRAALSSSTPNVVQLASAPVSANRAVTAHQVLKRSLWGWGLAATLVIATLGAVWQFQLRSPWVSYAAESARQRTVDLPDGSIVYLNAHSTLSVRMTDAERTIRLTRGEALFNVARDTARPFRVRTRDAVVEAIGTQFNVDTRSDGTHVAVVEGKVKVSRDGDEQTNASRPDSHSVTALAAGEAVQITRNGQISRHYSVDPQKEVAWSQPELIFEGASLEEAVEQFNRHRRTTRIRLVDIPPGSHHYTGVFNATDAESFAELLALEPDLSIEIGTQEIVIRGQNRN